MSTPAPAAPQPPSAVVATTPRLILREFQPSDAPDLYHLNSDPEVLRYAGDDPFIDVADALAFVHAYDNYARDGYGRWAVLRRDDQTFLGWSGLSRRADTGQTDIGFRFLRSAWRHGYATESAQAGLRLGFEQFGLEQIIARAEPENTASLHVIARLGLRPDTAQPTTADGMLRFILRRIDWERSHRNPA